MKRTYTTRHTDDGGTKEHSQWLVTNSPKGTLESLSLWLWNVRLYLQTSFSSGKSIHHQCLTHFHNWLAHVDGNRKGEEELPFVVLWFWVSFSVRCISVVRSWLRVVECIWTIVSEGSFNLKGIPLLWERKREVVNSLKQSNAFALKNFKPTRASGQVVSLFVGCQEPSQILELN